MLKNFCLALKKHRNSNLLSVPKSLKSPKSEKLFGRITQLSFNSALQHLAVRVNNWVDSKQ